MSIDDLMRSVSTQSGRLEIAADVLNGIAAKRVCELGVWEGEFSEYMLQGVPSISSYYMIDPWRHLDNWNKPFNIALSEFDKVYAKAMARTAFASGKVHVLRGTTSEVIDQIENGCLDAAYIDGDHTFRGITIDFVSIFSKIRDGGLLLGDDCCNSLWQHGNEFEPTGVFPMVLYLAEAFKLRLFLLPYNQFVVEKHIGEFELVNLSGHSYGDGSLLHQIRGAGE